MMLARAHALVRDVEPYLLVELPPLVYRPLLPGLVVPLTL